MLIVSDRIQIPSKTTYKDTGTKLNKYSETSKRTPSLPLPLELSSPTPVVSVHLKIKMSAIDGKTRYISTISRKDSLQSGRVKLFV